MSKISNVISQEGVAALRQQVEEYLQRKIVTPADYDFLSETIRERVRQSVSATTLKRMWGYVRDVGSAYKPSRYTMCALSRMLGFRDYEDFVASYNRGEVQSRTYRGETVMTSDLNPGDVMEISWSPARTVLLRYEGEGRFLVIKAVNAKIHEGDVVECVSFTQNSPLYINRVIRPSEPTMSYVAGSRSGIRFRLLQQP